MPSDDADIRDLAEAGRLIEAIRLYRERHGVDLAEARDAVERLRSGEAPAASAPPVERTALDPALLAEIDGLLRDGKRIPAIKLLRERFSTFGLKEAKDEIDRRAAARVVGHGVDQLDAPVFDAAVHDLHRERQGITRI